MGAEERRKKQRETVQKLILDTSHTLLTKAGLEGLTMRAIGDEIGYSQSKIYEFFSSKDKLSEALFQELCQKLLEKTQQIPQNLNPQEYLSRLVMSGIEFHADYPHSDELFTLICFGKKRFDIPTVYLELEEYPKNALRNLNSPHIQTEEEILLALDTIRCFKIGLSSLMSFDTSLVGKKRIKDIADNIVKTLLRSWKNRI